MNKQMKKILLFVLVVICLANCNSTKQALKIKSIKSEHDVTLFYSKKRKTITFISLPSEIIIENPSTKKKSFTDYWYIYGNKSKGNFISLYLIENEKLTKQSISKIKHIEGNSSKKYLITSKHFVDTTKFGRFFLKPYIEEMIRLKQDTLNVGTMSEFSKKQSKLIKWLTNNNDSIKIQPFKLKSGFEKEIRIPVEY